MYEVDGIFYEGADIELPKRPLSNEPIAIVRTVLTGLEYGFRKFHIQHVSNPFSVETISWLRNYADVSCEVTPHHLLLNSENISNSNFKINPPLVQERERKELVKMVKADLIDILASDHAPHFPKPEDFISAPFGTSNIEVAFSAYFTALENLELVITKMTSRPLKILGLTHRFSKDNLVFLDPNASFEVDSKKFKSKGKNCAFDGMKLKGKVVGLKINGKTVMWDGEIIS
jgi:dihydroorotase-like cyclic amidohydrolase